MQAFREMVSGWLGKTLLAALTLGMAGLTISSYFVTNSKPVVAEVNGEKIYQKDFDQSYEHERNQILQRMGSNFDPANIDEAKLRDDVLKSLIDQELIAQAAKKNNYLVADSQFAKWQQSQPAFWEDGKFSQQRYAMALQQVGQDPSTFPVYFKKRMASAELAESLTKSAFALDGDIKLLATIDSEKRDLSKATVDASAYTAGLTASDAEIKQYYDANPQRFTSPENVSLDYIQLNRDDFLAQATVTDDDLQARYQDHIKNLSESRHAQHILITVDKNTTDAQALKKIQDIEKRARAGEDFSVLAKQYSQDPGSVASGGDLGFYSKGGGFVQPFEDALFSLKVGEISRPVRTQYGYHLIKLLEVKKADVPSFDSLKPQLEADAKAAKADELYGDAVEKLDSAVYESSDLKDPAAKFKLPIQSTDFFTRAGGAGIAANRNVINVAFSDDLVKEGKSSQAIRLDDTHTVWFRVRAHQAARLQPLNEVANQVRGLVVLEKATAKAKAAAEAAAADINAGKSLADVARAHNLGWTSFAGLDHLSVKPGALSPDELKVAFSLPKPAAGKVSAKAFPGTTASFEILALTGVTPGMPTVPQGELAQLSSVVGENVAQYELLDYVDYLRQKATIKTYEIKSDNSQAPQ